MTEPSETEVRAFYRAALRALRFLEMRKPTGRRFGIDADARWKSFRGEYTVADRIDTLIRDANAQWPSSFGARTVFARHFVAEDEAFGAGWKRLPSRDAENLWRFIQRTDPPMFLWETFEACADAWDLWLAHMQIGLVRPHEKLLVVGPSAIATTLELFDALPGLDVVDQVVVLAREPAHRQLAALGSAFLNVTKPLPLVGSPIEVLPKYLVRRRTIASDDAHPEELALVGAFGEMTRG